MSSQHPERRSYSQPFAHLFSEIRRGLQSQLDQQSFYAIVSTYDSGPPKVAEIIRLGATSSEGPYRVANHIASLTAGTRVLVQDTTGEGGFVVMAEVTL